MKDEVYNSNSLQVGRVDLVNLSESLVHASQLLWLYEQLAD